MFLFMIKLVEVIFGYKIVFFFSSIILKVELGLFIDVDVLLFCNKIFLLSIKFLIKLSNSLKL